MSRILFLHQDLDEEIYMEAHWVLEWISKIGKCKLKQSQWPWFGRSMKVMLTMKYMQSRGDHTLFIKHTDLEGITILLVYVNDTIVTGKNPKEREYLQWYLAREFEIKELGKLKYFLGIKVAHSKESIFISQQKYVTDLLNEIGKLSCKPTKTPIESNHKLGEEIDGIVMNRGMYQRLVGKLIYLSNTKPDIAHVVNVVSQFMHNLKEALLQAEYWTLHHFKGTLVKGLLFKYEIEPRSLHDCRLCRINHGEEINNSLWYIFWRKLGNLWSKKQCVVAKSSAEAKFRLMAHGICKLLWLKNILNDLKVKCVYLWVYFGTISHL